MTIVRRYVALVAAVQLAACAPETETPTGDGQASTNVASAAAADRAPASAPAADARLVLAFGDSLYAGYGLGPSESFPAVLERELAERGTAARVVNAGVSGDTSAGGLRRLAFTLDGLERKPDLVILGLGANDVLRGLDPAETRANLTAMLDELKRREIPVMLTGMMAPRNMDGPYIRQFEAIYPELARDYGAALDPFFLDGVITRRELLLDDGLHPNARGIALIAERLAPKVDSELRETAA